MGEDLHEDFHDEGVTDNTMSEKRAREGRRSPSGSAPPTRAAPLRPDEAQRAAGLLDGARLLRDNRVGLAGPPSECVSEMRQRREQKAHRSEIPIGCGARARKRCPVGERKSLQLALTDLARAGSPRALAEFAAAAQVAVDDDALDEPLSHDARGAARQPRRGLPLDHVYGPELTGGEDLARRRLGLLIKEMSSGWRGSMRFPLGPIYTRMQSVIAGIWPATAAWRIC